jgi:hypothetical protein
LPMHLQSAILVQTVVFRVVGTVPVPHGPFLPLPVSPHFRLQSSTSPNHHLRPTGHRSLLSRSFQ